MSNALAVTLLASGAQTATSTGTSVDLLDVASDLPLRTTLILSVDVDVVAGTLPTLDMDVQTADATGGPWRTIGTLSQTVTAAGDFRFLVGDCERFVRLSWTITGTGSPSFTFGVSGVAHVTYASRRDMVLYGMSENVLDQIPEDRKLQALVAASAEMSTNLSVAFTLPLTAWGEDVTKHTAILAVWTAVANFREGLDETLVDLKDDTLTFMKRIGDGRLRPKTILDSTPDAEEDSAYIASSTSRGWT